MRVGGNGALQRGREVPVRLGHGGQAVLGAEHDAAGRGFRQEQGAMFNVSVAAAEKDICSAVGVQEDALARLVRLRLGKWTGEPACANGGGSDIRRACCNTLVERFRRRSVKVARLEGCYDCPAVLFLAGFEAEGRAKLNCRCVLKRRGAQTIAQ